MKALDDIIVLANEQYEAGTSATEPMAENGLNPHVIATRMPVTK